MNDVMSRLRAADPQAADPAVLTDGDVASVLAAARSAGGRHPAPPRRVARRTVLLGAVAAAAGAVAVPASGLLTRPDRMPKAQAALLREAAHRIAAQPAPAADRDVVYLNIRTQGIDVHSLVRGRDPSPDDPYVRTKAMGTEQWWIPLWPNREQGHLGLRGTSTLLTAADARRFAELPEADKKIIGDGPPPWSYVGTKNATLTEGREPGGVVNLTRKFVQGLPTDPVALESAIRNDPAVSDDVPPLGGGTVVHFQTALGHLLRYPYSPPKLKAAVLVLLAETDGSRVKVFGERRVGGRTALAMWWERMSPGEEELIDLETGFALGRSWILTEQVKRESAPWYDDVAVGTYLRKDTLLDFAYVGKVKQRP